MGVFGNRSGRSRNRKRVEEGLSGNSSWQVQVLGRAWVCPLCATVALDALPEAHAARVDAVIEHLEGGCPGWKGGQGPERPLVEIKKVAAHRELRRRVKTELVQNPAWQLIDSTRQWYCPYCGEGTGVLVPGDKRMTEDVLLSIVGHVDGCYAHRHAQAEKPLAHLKAIVKYANQSRRLGENVRKKLEGDPAWRRKDARQRWVCPYCLQAQEHIDLSSTLLMFENAPRLIAKHLAAACADFKSGGQPKPLETPERPPLGLVPGSQDPLPSSGSSRNLVAVKAPAAKADPRGEIPDTDPSGVVRPKRDSRSGRAPQADPPAPAPAAVPLDSGKLPALESDTGQVRTWGRDAMFAGSAGRGTTLRDLESSGELLLIDDEVRRLTARAPAEPAAPRSDAPDPREGSSAGGAPGKPATGRRTGQEWRREIEQELARVRSLAPAGSGEHIPAFDPGSEDELRALSRTLRLAERGVEVRRILMPASPPRGDFVDLRDLGGDQLGILAGGVLGDEPEGPLVAAMARNLARQALARDADPRDVLRRVNAELFPDLDGRVFVAMLCGVLDLQRLTLRVARAGLPAPMLVNAARAGVFGPLQTEGMVMGIDRGPIFDTTLDARSFELARGDLLVVHTTGLTEARGPSREEFGIERMQQLARRYGTHEVDYFGDKFREYFDLFVQDPASRTQDVVIAALKWL